ncbi:MAG: hypothetical protein LBI01_06730 [Elusimicrobium sp.]|jgi:hypothetical protein|nr:hypothetical protein [Elusimicrobium sp.]
MRYWVYINDKVAGPYEENKIPAVEGFTPDTLICSEIIEEGASQEWIPASSVLRIPDLLTDNVSERHLDTGISTNTYVAAKEVDIKEAEKPKTGASVHAASYSSGREEMLFEKILQLSKEIENLRSEVRKLAEKTSAQAAPIEDPLDKILTEAGVAPAGKIFTHEEVEQEEAVKTAIKSIAEDNTPPQMDILSVGGSAPQKAAPQPAPAHVKPAAEEIFKEEKIVDSFPASSVLPELNETLNAKPEEKHEDGVPSQSLDSALDSLFEPVKLQPIMLEEITAGKDDPTLTQTLTGPMNASTEEESAVVSSALDSLYRTPQAKPEPVKEPQIDFEDLIKKPEPAKAAVSAKIVAPSLKEEKPAKQEPLKEATMVTQINNTMSEIQLGNEKTSLISNFIPPSGMEQQVQKKEEAGVQEIVGNFTDGGLSGGEPTLHQAPVIKRVKPADIKTNPLISASKAAASAAPDTTEKISFMDQLGTEEETTAAPKTGMMKKIMVAVMSVILLLIIVFGLMFAKMIPDVFGLFTPKQQKAAASVAPAGPLPQSAPSAPAPSMPQPQPSAAAQMSGNESQILIDAQNHVLPNGMTLLGAVAARHPNQVASVDWAVKQYDPSNYIVSAKVPPETSTSLMTVYRFNYVPDTRELKPLTSDSKNLLGM